jgi:uncharacterized membrane protein YcaP (DUF421 family)
MMYIDPILRALAAILAVIALTRLQGLRSFSKMSSFDFALTLAVGSLLATTIISRDMNLLVGLIAIASVFLIQWVIAALRIVWPGFQRVADNEPLLLMKGRHIFDANLRKGRITEDDLYSKLREHGVVSVDQVRAVVLETTGNISVMHGEAELSPELLRGVRDGPSDAAQTVRKF